jgi:excisionase family DNA binding protein
MIKTTDEQLRGLMQKVQILISEIKSKEEPNVHDEYMSIKEVADKLKVSRQSLYNWRKDNSLPAIRMGRLYRYSRSSIDAFMRLDSS